ncbi:MAG: thioredoxin family protein [Candidatus Eiseniibacteriota bacterium]
MKLSPWIAAALLLGATQAPAGGGPATFAEAKALAAEQGKPLLVDFFATWCGPCKVFAKDAQSDAETMKALEAVVLFQIDAEKGEGIEMAKAHGVQAFPTFVLASSSGEPIDKWVGYGGGYFQTQLGEALADPTTVTQKRERFAAKPTAKDAETLARVHAAGGEFLEAVAHYRKAAVLDPSTNRDFQILDAMASGIYTDAFTADQAREAADVVVAQADRPVDQLVQTWFLMRRVEKKAEKADFATPYLEPALRAARTDENYADTAKDLEIDHALRVQKDKNRAYELKLASQAEGWKSDHDALNSVAWWCFENGVRLEEAEVLARRGIELAPAGTDKAAVLDTAAEICNARGNCPEAVVLIRQAVENAPESEYYKKQLERFETLTASTN